MLDNIENWVVELERKRHLCLAQLLRHHHLVALLDVQDEYLLREPDILEHDFDEVAVSVDSVAEESPQKSYFLKKFNELAPLYFVEHEVAGRLVLVHFVVVEFEVLKNIKALTLLLPVLKSACHNLLVLVRLIQFYLQQHFIDIGIVRLGTLF